MKKELSVLAEEYLIKKIIRSYGFERTEPENLTVYDKAAGQLVLKYGSFYNTEVLMNPPMRSSFYYPSRILVECKCCREALGIAFAKSVLSIKGSIMQNVSVNALSYSSSALSVSAGTKMVNSNYEVMFATLGTFSNEAVSFACANHIPFTSLGNNPIIAKMKECIRVLESKITKESEEYRLVLEYFDGKSSLLELKKNLFSLGNSGIFTEIEKFINRTEFVSMNLNVEMFDKGKILYLIWI